MQLYKSLTRRAEGMNLPFIHLHFKLWLCSVNWPVVKLICTPITSVSCSWLALRHLPKHPKMTRSLKERTKASNQMPPAVLHLIGWKLLQVFKGFHYVPCTIVSRISLTSRFRKNHNTNISYCLFYAHRAIMLLRCKNLLSYDCVFCLFCLIHYIGELVCMEEQQAV